MDVKDKKGTKKTSQKKVSAVVSEEVGSYEKHPFFVKKAKKAKALLLEVGLPEALKEKVKA